MVVYYLIDLARPFNSEQQFQIPCVGTTRSTRLGQTLTTLPWFPFPCKIFFILSRSRPEVVSFSVPFLSAALRDWSLSAFAWNSVHKAQMLGGGGGGKRVPFWMALLLWSSVSVSFLVVTGVVLVITVLLVIKCPQIINAPILV